jgi:hypothetical protein
MDQLLAGGSCKERSDDIRVSSIGKLNALPGEAPDVLAKSLIRLLPVAPEVLRVARVHIGALEVSHEDLL